MESPRPFVKDRLEATATRVSPHIKLTGDEWYFGLFKKGECPVNEGRNLNRELEGYMFERLSDEINGTNKTTKPKKEVFTDNVILNTGIQESEDRDIGVSSTELDWSQLGTSSTAEAVTQTDLVAEVTDTAYARKQFSVAGTRSRTLQTMIFAMLWDDSSFDATPKILREAGITWHLTTTDTTHARAIFSDFALDTGDTFIVRATELQQNGTL